MFSNLPSLRNKKGYSFIDIIFGLFIVSTVIYFNTTLYQNYLHQSTLQKQWFIFYKEIKKNIDAIGNIDTEPELENFLNNQKTIPNNNCDYVYDPEQNSEPKKIYMTCSYEYKKNQYVKTFTIEKHF